MDHEQGRSRRTKRKTHGVNPESIKPLLKPEEDSVVVSGSTSSGVLPVEVGLLRAEVVKEVL